MSPAWATGWPTSSSRRPAIISPASCWSASPRAAPRWPAASQPAWRPSPAHRSTSAPSTSRSTETTCGCAASGRWSPRCCPTPASTGGSSSSSTTSCSPAAPCAPRSTRCATSADRAPCSSPSWSTGATASCRSAPTTSARTCPRPERSRCGCTWPRSTAPTRSCSPRRRREATGSEHRSELCERGAERPRSRTGDMVRRHLLEAADLDRADATLVLDTAAQIDSALAGREVKKLPTLRGRTVVNLFYEDSTRTRISFEAAAKRLSADVINFSAKGSSVSKGESLKDTALTLQAMGADAVVIRHPASGAPHRLSSWVDGSVINAGDGTHEHPTQALLDAYTMRSRLGKLDGLRVAIVGDVLHSRVARSNVLLLTTLGAQVTLVGPPTLIPVDIAAALSPETKVSYDLDSVLGDVDVVMMLRVQTERMQDSYFPSAREYSRRYGLDVPRMRKLPEHAIVMHPGPMNRGMEIAPEVADSPRSTIVEQVANGVSARMAVLYLLLGGKA